MRAVRAPGWRARLHLTVIDAGWLAGFAAGGAALPLLSPLWRAVAGGYLLLEVGFWVYGRWRYAILNQRSDSLPDPARRDLVMRRFFGLAELMSMDDFMCGWFMGAPAASILRGNVEEVRLLGAGTTHAAVLWRRGGGGVAAAWRCGGADYVSLPLRRRRRVPCSL